MRERIAYLAARLIAEDGLEDFAQAKRKAAQQIGAPDTKCMPNNSEIERALRTFQSLYQQEEQPRALAELRREAVFLMRLLEAFDPYLSGPVLTGTAGKYSEIELQIYRDSAKDLEIFLLNNRIPYKPGEAKTACGAVPMFELQEGGIRAKLIVLPEGEQYSGPKSARARRTQVEALLEREISGEKAC